MSDDNDRMLKRVGFALGLYVQSVIAGSEDPGGLAKVVIDAIDRDIQAQRDVISGRRRFRLQSWLWFNGG